MPVSRKLALSPALLRALCVAAAFTSTVACGGPPGPAKPPLADGDGPFRLRFNRAPAWAGSNDLDFEVEGPAGWERISIENPDEEQDLLAALQVQAQASPLGFFVVEGTFRPETRAFGDHSARVFRLTGIGGAASDRPAGP